MNLKTAEERLRKSKRRLRGMVENIPLGIAITDQGRSIALKAGGQMDVEILDKLTLLETRDSGIYGAWMLDCQMEHHRSMAISKRYIPR